MADSAGGTPRATLHNGDEGGLVAAARGMGYGTGGRVGVFFRLGALQEPLLDPTPPQTPTPQTPPRTPKQHRMPQQGPKTP